MPRVDAEWAEQAVAEQIWALADPVEVMAAANRHIRSLADVSDTAEADRQLAAAEEALWKGRKGLRTALAVAIRAGTPETEVEAVVGAAQAELALLEGRVQRLQAAAEAVPPDPEWAQLMSRAVIHLARKLNEPAADLAAFGSVMSALGVKVRALEYASKPSFEVTATVTRAALLDLLGDLGDVAQRSSTCWPRSTPVTRAGAARSTPTRWSTCRLGWRRSQLPPGWAETRYTPRSWLGCEWWCTCTGSADSTGLRRLVF